MNEPRKFSAAELAAEARRETAMRIRVYGKTGSITRENADRIAMMQQIAEEYLAKAETERLL